MSKGNQPRYSKKEDEATALVTRIIAQVCARMWKADKLRNVSRTSRTKDYVLTLSDGKTIGLEIGIKKTLKVETDEVGYPVGGAHVELRKAETDADFYVQYIMKSGLLWLCKTQVLRDAAKTRKDNRRADNETFLVIPRAQAKLKHLIWIGA